MNDSVIWLSMKIRAWLPFFFIRRQLRKVMSDRKAISQRFDAPGGENGFWSAWIGRYSLVKEYKKTSLITRQNKTSCRHSRSKKLILLLLFVDREWNKCWLHSTWYAFVLFFIRRISSDQEGNICPFGATSRQMKTKDITRVLGHVIRAATHDERFFSLFYFASADDCILNLCISRNHQFFFYRTLAGLTMILLVVIFFSSLQRQQLATHLLYAKGYLMRRKWNR